MRLAKDAFYDPTASLAENNKANIFQNKLKSPDLYRMQNEVDARAEENTKVMRKIAMLGTVTPASVLAEAVASVTLPKQETGSKINAPSRLASCSLDKRRDVSVHLSDYSEIITV
jgi:hypothetical protein